MRKLLSSILVAGVALSAGAQTVKIGWFGPETGDSALFGQAEKNTVLAGIRAARQGPREESIAPLNRRCWAGQAPSRSR